MGKNIIKAGFLAVLILSAGAVQAADKMKKGLESAVFAGGCFWCVEKDFDHVKGVVETTSGYTGGILLNPTYRQVTAGRSGHYEAVEIKYDPKIVTYKQLVEVFWRTVDPTDGGGQFCDRGQSYAPAIFANSPEQQKIAEMSLATLKKSGALKRPVKTPILKAAKFYPAEGYHQNYYKKNPIRYNFYRKSCGRNARVKEVWGDQAYQGVEKH
jgi:peptide-methionine (S)-S-oxide reductase